MDVQKEIRKDHKRLLDNMVKLQKLYSAKALTELIGVTKTTWTSKMKEPWKRFSYDEFRMISRYCDISFTDLMEGVLKL